MNLTQGQREATDHLEQELAGPDLPLEVSLWPEWDRDWRGKDGAGDHIGDCSNRV